MKKSKARRALLRERKQARADKLQVARAVLALDFDGRIPHHLHALNLQQTEQAILRRRAARNYAWGEQKPHTGRMVHDRTYRYQNLPYPKP